MPHNRTMILWGDTQVGKTSLLSAGFMSKQATRRLKGIDWSSSSDASRVLGEKWQRLHDNSTLSPNVETLIDLRVDFTSENPDDRWSLNLRDVLGGATGNMRMQELQILLKALEEADAALFVLEWRANESSSQLRALHYAVRQLGEKLKKKITGVAFTKCERYLSGPNDELFVQCFKNASGSWWKGALPDLSNDDQLLLSELGPVWSTSVYGFRTGKENCPACLLDEFGELIPFHIQPLNVVEVFEWFIQQLAPRSSS